VPADAAEYGRRLNLNRSGAGRLLRKYCRSGALRALL